MAAGLVVPQVLEPEGSELNTEPVVHLEVAQLFVAVGPHWQVSVFVVAGQFAVRFLAGKIEW